MDRRIGNHQRRTDLITPTIQTKPEGKTVEKKLTKTIYKKVGKTLEKKYH